MTVRPLHVIAGEITADWQKPYFGAVPYLSAMTTLVGLDASCPLPGPTTYGLDDGRSIVVYFLANAGTWKGEVARRVKAELKGMLAQKSTRTPPRYPAYIPSSWPR